MEKHLFLCNKSSPSGKQSYLVLPIILRLTGWFCWSQPGSVGFNCACCHLGCSQSEGQLGVYWSRIAHFQVRLAGWFWLPIVLAQVPKLYSLHSICHAPVADCACSRMAGGTRGEACQCLLRPRLKPGTLSFCHMLLVNTYHRARLKGQGIRLHLMVGGATKGVDHRQWSFLQTIFHTEPPHRSTKVVKR